MFCYVSKIPPKNFDIPLPKHHCECQLMKLKTSAVLPTCTCDQLSRGLNDVEEQANGFQRSKRLPAVGVGWLTPDEVEGLASVVTKLELKSQGCFGQVWHGQFQKPPHGSSELGRCMDVAVKVFRAAQKDSWITELGLFRVPGLSHPNILKFIGADQTMNNCLDPPEVEYWLVTEYHQLGSLYDYLKAHTIHWTELLQIAVGVARGLSHLHSEITSLGTRRYMAPEVLDGAIQFSRDAYLRIDVYAMGLVFWELMSRCYGSLETPIEVAGTYRAPFELELGPAPTIEELQRFVAQEKQRPKFNPNWSHSLSMCTLCETTEECWDQDAEARLSAGCVAERLTTLSSQPWSGPQLYGQGLPTSSNMLSHCPTSLPGLTFRPVQPVSVVRTSNRVGVSSPISFPVPSTSVPLTTSYDYLHDPKCRDIQEGTSNGSLSRLFPVTRPSLTANDCLYNDRAITRQCHFCAICRMTTVDLETADSDDSQTEEGPAEETEKSVGHLREEALQRKQRLLQLRKRKFRKLGDTGVEDAESELPKPVFRNYKPQSGDLKSGELPAAPPVDLTPYVTSQLEAANAPVIMEEVNLMSLAPRKPDWDLKRGVDKKLQKLERRTQRAIAELIRKLTAPFYLAWRFLQKA
ncbi:Cwf18 pre-mRNA splicing factor, partial [Opisthorchis viverrini]